MKFKTKMCARTIRNNIYEKNIYDIKSNDMTPKNIKKKIKIREYMKKYHRKKV